MWRTPSWRRKQHIRQKRQCKTKKNFTWTTLAVTTYNCTIATCYTDTGSTYSHVIVLHYNSTMSVCSQAEGSLSISTALLQNTAANKNKKFSAFLLEAGNLLPYSQYHIIFPHSEPAESDQHFHTRHPLIQYYSSIYTQLADVFKATLFRHFSSRLWVPHALFWQFFIFLFLSYLSNFHVILSSFLSLPQSN